MVADYYAMLGIAPRADRAAIEAALDAARHQWSSGTRNPKYKHAYQSNLDQVPEIRRRLLGDPATRAAYDSELAAEEVGRTQAKLDALQRLVRLRAAKGGLTISDRSLLRDRASLLGLTADDLARLIEPIPPMPEAPAAVEPAETGADALDPVTRRQIRTALDLVGKRDLYQALDLPRDADASEIAAKADEGRGRWMRKSQVTAEKTAWLEVVSYAQSHLCTPAGRIKYDRTLELEAEDEFAKSVDFALEAVAALDPRTRQVLVDEASALGIQPDRGDRLIDRACRARGVAREGGHSVSTAGGPPVRYLRCRSCGGMNEFARVAKQPDRANCRHCRAALRWGCPTCRLEHWVDEPRCRCGFEVAHLEPLLRHFEAAQHAHRVRDYSAALEHLARVQEFAPRHVGARKGIEKVRERLAEIEARKADFALARSRNQLVAARTALLAWGRLVDPASPEVLDAQEALVAGLRDAQTLVSKARALEATDSKAAREFYRKALAVAADLPDARDGLKRLAPDPPSALVVDVAGETVALRWTPPAPDGLGDYRYRVVRKVGGTPSQASDGATVAEVDTPESIDRGATPGRVVGYAVFTIRNGVTSISGASAAPVAMLPDVRDLRAVGSQGVIQLSWSLPPGATGARAVRIGTAGAPDRPLEALAEHAEERGLDEDRVYRYRVSASYRGLDGRTQDAQGVEVVANSAEAIANVGPITLRREADGRVELAWPPLARGTCKVLRSPVPLLMPVGSRITTGEAGKLAGTWIESARIDGATDLEPPTVGVCHYTPLVFLNGSATVGAAVGYSTVSDPSDLRAVRAGGGGRVHLRWRWTPRAVETFVVASQGRPPVRPDEPGSMTTAVHEGDYSRQGYFAISLPTEASSVGSWHIAVFSVVTADGVKLISPGLEPTARTTVPGPNPEITISYQLRRPGFPGRPWTLTIQTEPPGSPVPPMALVSHPRTVPLAADDGEIVERFPASRDGAAFTLRPRPGQDFSRHCLRLFADPGVDPAGSPPIRLRHPESAGTRV